MAKPAFRIKDYKSAARPWLKHVVRSNVSGRWERKFFATKGEAETYVAARERELRAHGTEGVTFPAALRVMAQRESERLRPFDKTLTDAVDFYVQHLQARAGSVPIEQLRAEFVSNREAAGRDKRYVYDIGNRTSRFCRDFPKRIASEFSTADMDAWLEGLSLAADTRNTYRRDLRTMFSFAVTRKYCSSNPVSDTAKAKGDDNEVEILSVPVLAKLLSAASTDMIPFWTIGAFAGLRRSEIERMDWADIDFKAKTIHVRGRRRKTEKSRRFVTIQPNLRAWLLPHRQESGKVHPTNLRKRFDADREAAGLRAEWPDNALRHSFGSYHLAKFGNAPALALEMGNSVDVIFKHYRQLVKPKAAAAYWKIRPEAAPKNGKVVQFAA